MTNTRQSSKTSRGLGGFYLIKDSAQSFFSLGKRNKTNLFWSQKENVCFF
jgi:hypothetical protein